MLKIISEGGSFAATSGCGGRAVEEGEAPGTGAGAESGGGADGALPRPRVSSGSTLLMGRVLASLGPVKSRLLAEGILPVPLRA
jgi:hypothetical protein